MYYSPYFKGCFGSRFKEAIEGVLRLPEDNPKHFEVLANYMRTGSTVYDCGIKTRVRGAFNVENFQECVNFIAFTDKYDLTQAATAVARALKACLAEKHLAAWMEDKTAADTVKKNGTSNASPIEFGDEGSCRWHHSTA